MVKSFWCSLVVLLLIAFVLPIAAIAGDKEKEDADEVNSPELELKACGAKDKEVKYSADTDKSSHPTPAQPADKALVYVLRPSMMGNKVQPSWRLTATGRE